MCVCVCVCVCWFVWVCVRVAHVCARTNFATNTYMHITHMDIPIQPGSSDQVHTSACARML